MTDTSPLALTIDEAVAAARVSRSEIYRALQRKELVAKKQGRRTLILRDELSRYLATLPDYQAAA
jgi:excisionase family DNA binding protein